MDEGLFYFVRFPQGDLFNIPGFLDEVKYSINLSKPDQLYFFLGDPATFLCQLYQYDPSNEGIREAVMKLLDWLEPNEYVYQSKWSVEVLEAAIEVSKASGGIDRYDVMAEKIASNLIANQNPDGTFYNPTDIDNTWPGTTAEIALVLNKYSLLT